MNLKKSRQVEMNWIEIIPVKCDCCGKMTKGYSSKGWEWFGKYLKDDEEKICHDCIKDRPGYAEEFEKMTGVSIGIMNIITKGDIQQ